MKRIISIIASASIACISMSAQSKVRGVVVDSSTNEAEQYAVVQIFSAANNQTSVAHAITDAMGEFSLDLKNAGDYVLVFENLGRKTVSVPFTMVSNGDVDLGKILAEDDAEMLEAGSVTALKNLVKMDVDKVTYKIEDDIDSKSYTLLDMLRKVPMVSVDAQDNITVNGSSNFQVLVDGKPNVMMSSNPSQVFKSMPATFAKSVEVVTNPGVKYDAEGVGGVLNITTNSVAMGGQSMNLDGYTATLGTMVNDRGASGRAFVTGQNGKLSYSANVNFMKMTVPGNESTMTREQLDDAGNVISTLETNSSSTMKTPSVMGTVSIGYEIDPLRLVSATFGYTKFASDQLGDNQTTMTSPFNSFSYGSKTESVWDMNSITGSIDYQRSFAGKPGQSLTLSYQISSSPSATDSKSIFDGDAPMFNFTDRYTDGSTNTIQNTFQADFTSKLYEKLLMDAGVKYINRLNKSDQALFLADGNEWKADDAGSLIYRHDNNIIAAYGELSCSAGSISAKAGLRYEYTFLDVNYKKGSGENFSLGYGNLVPAASLQYNIGMTQNIGLTYNMRISRPGITYLNPYIDISDPTAKKYGNSSLDTERAHNISLVYNFLSSKVMVNSTLRYTYCGNAISNYSFFDADGILNSTYGNNTVNQNVSFSTMLMWNIGSKTRVVLNGALNYMDLGSESLGLSNSGLSGNVMANIQQTLPWDVRLSANAIWSSKNYSLEGWSTGMTMITAGLTKTFFDDKLSVGLNYVTPATFSKYLVMETHTATSEFKLDSVNKIKMGTISLNLSWSFGSNNRASVKKTRKTITNDDVMDRSNDAQQMNSMMGM